MKPQSVGRYMRFDPMIYKINEIFTTIQSEGTHTGTPSIFIRFQGCDVGCGFCDTKFTWEENEQDETIFPNMLKKEESGSPKWAWADVPTIVHQASLYPYIKHVVMTGGEPCMQQIRPLIIALEQTDRTVQIETSGTEVVDCTDDTWVTLSPKIKIGKMKPIIRQAVQRANEIKYVIGAESHIKKLDELLEEVPINKQIPIYLQPMSQLPKATQACIKLCMQRNWKLSIQTHKYIEIR